MLLQRKPKLPFKPLHQEQAEKKQRQEFEIEAKKYQETHILWVESIKKLARQNINNDMQYMRIAWTNRFGIPKYQAPDEYTPEEMLLETWEQYYYENPANLEMNGIFQRKNSATGYKYYVTGDPVIDALEKEFAEGKVPDLEKAFGHIKNGPDFFRSYYRNNIPAEKLYQDVKKNEKGEKISEAGTKVEVDQYKGSDEWVKDALTEDPVMKLMAEKLGVKP